MTYDTSLFVFCGGLAIGFGGWLIRMQARVQAVEQRMTDLHDDIGELKVESRATREGVGEITKKVAVLIDRMDRSK